MFDRSRTPAERVTYGELWARCLRFAGHLRRAGHQPGQRIGLLADNCAEWCTANFGALAAGCAIVPLNTRLPLETQAFIAVPAEPEAVAAAGPRSSRSRLVLLRGPRRRHVRLRRREHLPRRRRAAPGAPPAVHQAVVVPVPDELKHSLPVRIPARCGSSTRFVDEIPLASTAEIDRRALMDDAARRWAGPRA